MNWKQEDLQSLGFFGILKESIKIIFTWPKIFIKIILVLIIPSSCSSLAKFWILMPLYSKIIHNMSTLGSTQVHYPTYNIPDSTSSGEMIYWFINAGCFVLSIIFSLLSISAIVYTVASIYTIKEITFRKVISALPKMWKRLKITFKCKFFLLLACSSVFAFALSVLTAMFTSFLKLVGGKQLEITILMIIYTLILTGVVYMSIIWQLAYVISVMENDYGLEALERSKELTKGNLGTSIAIYLVEIPFLVLGYILFQQLVVIGGRVGVGGKVCYGILSLGLLSFPFLLTHVAQTVLYFVCKSYHHENIDKSSLADHLEVFNHGDYVALKTKGQELWEPNV